MSRFIVCDLGVMTGTEKALITRPLGDGEVVASLDFKVPARASRGWIIQKALQVLLEENPQMRLAGVLPLTNGGVCTFIIEVQT